MTTIESSSSPFSSTVIDDVGSAAAAEPPIFQKVNVTFAEPGVRMDERSFDPTEFVKNLDTNEYFDVNGNVILIADVSEKYTPTITDISIAQQLSRVRLGVDVRNLMIAFADDIVKNPTSKCATLVVNAIDNARSIINSTTGGSLVVPAPAVPSVPSPAVPSVPVNYCCDGGCCGGGRCVDSSAYRNCSSCRRQKNYYQSGSSSSEDDSLTSSSSDTTTTNNDDCSSLRRRRRNHNIRHRVRDSRVPQIIISGKFTNKCEFSTTKLLCLFVENSRHVSINSNVASTTTDKLNNILLNISIKLIPRDDTTCKITSSSSQTSPPPSLLPTIATHPSHLITNCVVSLQRYISNTLFDEKVISSFGVEENGNIAAPPLPLKAFFSESLIILSNDLITPSQNLSQKLCIKITSAHRISSDELKIDRDDNVDFLTIISSCVTSSKTV